MSKDIEKYSSIIIKIAQIQKKNLQIKDLLNKAKNKSTKLLQNQIHASKENQQAKPIIRERKDTKNRIQTQRSKQTIITCSTCNTLRKAEEISHTYESYDNDLEHQYQSRNTSYVCKFCYPAYLNQQLQGEQSIYYQPKIQILRKQNKELNFLKLKKQDQTYESKKTQKKFQKKCGDNRKKLIIDLMKCPITQQLMNDPILLINCGHTFQYKAVITWLRQKEQCPLCKTRAQVWQIQRNFLALGLLGIINN